MNSTASSATAGNKGYVRIGIDIGEVTFKKGDTITINAIIMPWGSQESDFSGKNFAPDVNVRAVRENTILNRAFATPVSDCEKVSRCFLPSIRSTNGTSAKFLLSGGENNIAVRVYGFERLAKPAICELVGGEWEKYELSSINTPDAQGKTHAYDGYNVFFDGDGSYSYSFVVTMNGGKERQFKIEV